MKKSQLINLSDRKTETVSNLTTDLRTDIERQEELWRNKRPKSLLNCAE